MSQLQETEHDALEFKEYLDPEKVPDRMKLVKEIVAMANGTGGRILVGVRDDGKRVGIPDRDRTKWDPAAIGSQVQRYIEPERLEVPISIRRDGCPEGTFMVQITVTQHPDPPLVMCRDGTTQSTTIIRKGDVPVRNNTKVEAASRADYVRWRNLYRQRLLENFNTILLNPNATVQITQGDEMLNTPSFLLSRTVDLFRQRPDRLLDAKDLLYLFTNRNYLDTNSTDVRRLLMHSSLRRKATLWFWLALLEVEPDEVKQVLFEALTMNDRDKSDMSRAMVQVGCLFLTSAQYRELISEMEASRYAHIREAAEQYPDISDAKALIEKRPNMTIQGRSVWAFKNEELIKHAEYEIERGRRYKVVRRLPILGLEYFLRRRSRGVMGETTFPNPERRV